jgi:hypothetical protein
VRVAVQVRSAEFEPLDNAQVRMRVSCPDGSTLDLPAEPSTQGAGVYEAHYVPRQAGAYRAEIQTIGPDGEPLEARETGWTSEPATDEFRTLNPNRKLLDELAERSGGEVLFPNELERFVASLPNRQIPVTEPWIYPLWHRWSVFGLAMACLIGEWGLRRWRGLP